MKHNLLLLFILGYCHSYDVDPWLCRNNYNCECMEGNPRTVDCSQFNIDEFPLTSEDSYSYTWALFLDDNHLKDIPIVPKQGNLTMLSLSNNPIITIADSAFTNLEQMRILNLSNCGLTRAHLTLDVFKGPDDIGKNSHSPLTSLETLDLSNNYINSVDSHAFNHLINLKTLLLNVNPILDFQTATIYAFSELVNLEVLDLSRTEIMRIPNHLFSSMRKLKELNLSGNRFTTVPQDVNFAVSLQFLNLDYNPIKVLSRMQYSGFHSSKSLQEISLSHMPELSIIERDSFDDLANLTTLRIHNNPKLSAINFHGFNSSENIKRVLLNANNLKSLSELLLPWSQLLELDLQNNPWHCDCHIQWLVDGPITSTLLSDERYIQHLTCASPDQFAGMPFTQLIADKAVLYCSNTDRHGNSPASYAPIVAITIFIGAFLLLSSMIMVVYTIYHKCKDKDSFSQTVTYRRARNTDLESIASNLYT